MNFWGSHTAGNSLLFCAEMTTVLQKWPLRHILAAKTPPNDVGTPRYRCLEALTIVVKACENILRLRMTYAYVGVIKIQKRWIFGGPIRLATVYCFELKWQQFCKNDHYETFWLQKHLQMMLAHPTIDVWKPWLLLWKPAKRFCVLEWRTRM